MKLRKSLRAALESEERVIRKHAYNILGALRGPDSESGLTNRLADKRKYTVPIRCFAYDCSPAQLVELGSATGNPAPTTQAGWKALLDFSPGNHFEGHVKTAIRGILAIEEWPSGIPSEAMKRGDIYDITFKHASGSSIERCVLLAVGFVSEGKGTQLVPFSLGGGKSLSTNRWSSQERLEDTKAPEDWVFVKRVKRLDLKV